MKFNKNHLNRRWVGYTIAACSAVFFYVLITHLYVFAAGLHQIMNYVKPVVIGIVIAYILYPLVILIENRLLKDMKSRNIAHILATVITIVVLLLFIAILIVALVPQLVNSIITFVRNIGSYGSTMTEYFRTINDTAEKLDVDISAITNALNSTLDSIISWLPNNIENIINTSYYISMGVFDWIIGFIMAIYFLMDAKRIASGVQYFVKLVIGEKAYSHFALFCNKSNRIIVRYISCDLIDALIIGVTNYIFMMMMGMNYGILISVIVGVMNLAPTFGPIVGGAIGAFILVLMNPWHALAFIIFTLFLQIIDGYLIKPKLFGNTLGVPSVSILIFIIIGGRVFGVWGILLAIPVAAIVHFVYRDNLMPWMQKKRGIKPPKYWNASSSKESVKIFETERNAEEMETSDLADDNHE